jgi:hypothetical protein
MPHSGRRWRGRVSGLTSIIPGMDELLDQIRRAADQTGHALFLELLRWHRAVVGLPDFDPRARGAYWDAIAELGDVRAEELLGDLRRVARDPRRHRSGTDGKPRYWSGKTIAGRYRER